VPQGGISQATLYARRKKICAAGVDALNQCWSMDFVADALFDGRRRFLGTEGETIAV